MEINTPYALKDLLLLDNVSLLIINDNNELCNLEYICKFENLTTLDINYCYSLKSCRRNRKTNRINYF